MVRSLLRISILGVFYVLRANFIYVALRDTAVDLVNEYDTSDVFDFGDALYVDSAHLHFRGSSIHSTTSPGLVYQLVESLFS